MSKRILIVDDDVELSEMMLDILRDAGHVAEAYLFDRSNTIALPWDDYDAVILDFKMPGFTGADILKSLPERSIRSKIFLISGRPFIEQKLKDENLLHKVAAIIPKPFSIQMILDKISSL